MKKLLFFAWVTLGAAPRGMADGWEFNSQPEEWPQARTVLGEKLQEKVRREGPAGLKLGGESEKEFRLWQWMGEWPHLQGNSAAEFRELGKNWEVSRVYLENVREEDRRAVALGMLIRMHREALPEMQELPRLAVALALVLDQPFPGDWPHRQVFPHAVPKADVDPVIRLKEMAQLQSRRRFAFDLSSLTVSELKFLVDHPLPESEMEWARKNVTTSRSSFDKVFSGIRYDMARLQAGEWVWPHGAYRLENIKQKGGICVDQAYFAAMAGKARGLPTLFFTGQGESGGHAWFGYLDAPGRWVTDCGRYAEENYPVGNATDPQTWKPITDTELVFLAKGRERSEGFRQAGLWTDFAVAFPGDTAVKFLEAALEIQPEYLPAWLALGAAQASLGEPVGEKEFWEKFIKRFARYPDLKVVGQERLLALARARGDIGTVKNLERQILVQNRARRFDLSIGAAAAQVGEKIETGDWPGAQSAFRQALREFKGQAGGHLFYGLVEPFVGAALAEGQLDVAQNAFQEGKRVLRPGKDTLVGRGLADLEEKIKLAKTAR